MGTGNLRSSMGENTELEPCYRCRYLALRAIVGFLVGSGTLAVSGMISGSITDVRSMMAINRDDAV